MLGPLDGAVIGFAVDAVMGLKPVTGAANVLGFAAVDGGLGDGLLSGAESRVGSLALTPGWPGAVGFTEVDDASGLKPGALGGCAVGGVAVTGFEDVLAGGAKITKFFGSATCGIVAGAGFDALVGSGLKPGVATGGRTEAVSVPVGCGDAFTGEAADGCRVTKFFGSATWGVTGTVLLDELEGSGLNPGVVGTVTCGRGTPVLLPVLGMGAFAGPWEGG